MIALTGGIVIAARSMTTAMASVGRSIRLGSMPRRQTYSLTGVPGLPLRRLITSVSGLPIVGQSSTRTILSSEERPALYAGPE